MKCIQDAIGMIKASTQVMSLASFPSIFNFTFAAPPLGKILLLTAFSCTIGALIVSVDAPRFSNHFIDDVAFRAAWVTLAQVPLVYLLATKRGPLNILLAVSYERINWIHRWAGRVLFLSATVHMSIMIRSIDISDIPSSPDKIMIIVRYGAGAYGILTWIGLSSVLPVRKWSYQLFYINHWISNFVFVWVLFQHIPEYARKPIYLSIGIFALDSCLFWCSFFRNNTSIHSIQRTYSKLGRALSRKAMAMGHPVKMTAPILGCPNSLMPELTTIIRICDVPFSWKPGQHVRLYLPKLGALEVHPFTPATCSPVCPLPPSDDSDIENDRLLSPTFLSTSPLPQEMILMIRAHSGLTQRLAEYHRKWLSRPCPNSSKPSSSLTAYLDGPYGTPPAWEEFPNLVLVGTSTGVSFSLSIIDYLEQICIFDPSRLRTKRIHFVWSVRHLEPQFNATVMDMLERNSEMLRMAGISVTASFFSTCLKSSALESASEAQHYDPFAHLRQQPKRYLSDRPPLRIYNPDKIFEVMVDEDEVEDEYMEYIDSEESDINSRLSFGSDMSSTLIDESEDEEEAEEAPHGSFWSQFRPRGFRHVRITRDTSPATNVQSCSCAFVQSQLQQPEARSKCPDFITHVYGARPDLDSMLASIIPGTEEEMTMVAVCSNMNVVAQVRNRVARMNLDFVAGRREERVEIFCECFS